MGTFKLGQKRPLIISGPCAAETYEQTIETATQLARSGKVDVIRAGVWKPRTNPGTFEGIGEPALDWLNEIKQSTGLPVAVEVANKAHVQLALKHGVDILWIGARTTVSPFAVQEIAEALHGNQDITVLVKNPMTPDTGLWAGAVNRLLNEGIPEENIGLIHRGFAYFGDSKYRNPPMWHMIFEMRSRFPNMMMICDPSHICGCRPLLQGIAQQAADLCFDGMMIESHIAPDKAWSDSAQQVTPQDCITMIDNIMWRAKTADDPEFNDELNICRRQIDQIDAEIFDLLNRRMHTSDKIGEIKKANNVAILQSNRWEDICRRMLTITRRMGLSEEFVRTVLEAIHVESINRQNEIMNH
ncbi:MAG: bifunctional 3-deoxy-7-phosphoheptulonate synthase/chorismate mutase type II [Alistipes sp.]|jgi:chorismate mutase|nr:bifunctional 3-deoxy-7-phosphoheptulonate synthase/chorismate mutase type II [Alistipes sp.]MBQ6581595.1 bifunctional 3-deoxy-7-phosphoheptulonate synthase/chorismate mutase type II [Alistipes sp.]